MNTSKQIPAALDVSIGNQSNLSMPISNKLMFRNQDDLDSPMLEDLSNESNGKKNKYKSPKANVIIEDDANAEVSPAPVNRNNLAQSLDVQVSK